MEVAVTQIIMLTDFMWTDDTRSYDYSLLRRLLLKNVSCLTNAH
jgi:hypothetical protein